jgi:SAM-dependent methyltransferase
MPPKRIFGEFFILKRRIKKLIKEMPQQSTDLVLDMGCGEEPYYHSAIKGRIISADIKKSKTTDIVCDSHSIPLKKGKFDKVLFVNSLYYFSNPLKALLEAKRVLKKNGKLLIVVPFIYPIHDAPLDKYRFTEYGIRKLLEGAFAIEEIRPVGGIFTLPSVVLHSMVKGFMTRNPALKAAAIALYPLYLLSQLLSLLDFLDRTGRWPVYYFVVASKEEERT